MKLKTQLREHFSSSNGKITWIAKKAFESKDEIKEEEYPSFRWHTYTCGFCHKLHVGSNKKDEQ